MGSLGLTPIQKEEINQLVFDDYIKKISTTESAAKIRQLFKLPENRFTGDWVWKLRRRLKCSAKNELLKYQQDRYAYIQKYLDRIHNIEQLEAETWNFLKKKHRDEIVLRTFSELREIEILLTDLYTNLPRVANIEQHDYARTDNTDIKQESKESDPNRKF